MDKATVDKIFFEINQIDKLLDEAKPCIEACEITEPDFVERCGLALILQSFYNGIELILLMVFKPTDHFLQNQTRWHKALLSNAFESKDNQTQLLRDELRVLLNDYLKFRHLARHTYGFQLKWDEMKMLVFNLEKTWEIVKSDLMNFMDRHSK